MMRNQQQIILPQQHQNIIIRFAHKDDSEGAKKVASMCGKELGFVNIATLRQAQENRWLLVASEWNFQYDSDIIIGFVNFRIKKDNTCTLYDIAVKKEYRGKGIGTRLLNYLKRLVYIVGGEGSYIQLKCPIELQANQFYQKL